MTKSIIDYLNSANLPYRNKNTVFFITSLQRFAWICLILIILPCVAYSENLYTEEPQLRIELGMHISQIDRISVNDNCTLMVTGSADKTARLWDLPTTDKNGSIPRLLRTFRPPINPNSFDGRVYAVAMHPVGKFVALSGYTPSTKHNRWSVYIFDTQSAQVIATIDDNPHRVLHLVFSPDGEYLAATMKSGFGMRVWKTGDWKKPVAEDNKGYGESNGATFDHQGRLYTTAYNREAKKNGYLRRYSEKTFNLEQEVEIEDGPEPAQVAAQLHGDLLAVGLVGKAGVYLFQSSDQSMKPIGRANTDGLTKSIGKISWSSDGKHLYAGGSYEKGGSHLFRVWADEGKGEPKDFEGPQWFISQLLPCGDQVAFGSREPAFGLIDAKGTRKIWQSRVGVSMIEKQFGHLKVSNDGLRISFGLGPGSETPIIFDVSKLRLTDASEGIVGLHPADYTSLPITNWNQIQTIPDGNRPVNPLFKGRPISKQLPNGEVKERTHRYSNDEEWTSLAIAPNKRNFVLGTEWRLRGYDVKNVRSPLWVNKNIPGKIWAVNIARNGKLVIVAYDDGTIRWHRMSDGTELLALLVNPDDRRWIAWTPKGYFTASIGGEDLIGWHVNQGPDKAALFYPVHHFREKYYRSNIVQQVLITLDETKTIQIDDDKLRKVQVLKKEIKSLSNELPPVVELQAPGHNHKFYDTEQIIKFVVHAPSSLKPTKYEVLVDGILQNTYPLTSFDVDRTLYTQVVLPQKDSQVTLLVYSGDVQGLEQSVRFKWGGGASSRPDKPNLFGLAVGITNYKNSILRYADKDADDFAKALKAQEGKTFGKVDIEVVNNKGKSDIIDALQKLAAKVRFQPSDTVTAIFYSGHGATKQGRFYFLPIEPQLADFVMDGISQEDFYYYLNDIKGRKVLFLDACWSNALASGIESDFAGFLNDIKRRGRLGTFVYAATDRGQASTALECEEQKHGCFTKALLEAIEEGRADQYSPLKITDTYEVNLYLTRRVWQLSKKTQRPRTVSTDTGLLNFPVATH